MLLILPPSLALHPCHWFWDACCYTETQQKACVGAINRLCGHQKTLVVKHPPDLYNVSLFLPCPHPKRGHIPFIEVPTACVTQESETASPRAPDVEPSHFLWGQQEEVFTLPHVSDLSAEPLPMALVSELSSETLFRDLYQSAYMVAQSICIFSWSLAISHISHLSSPNLLICIMHNLKEIAANLSKSI